MLLFYDALAEARILASAFRTSNLLCMDIVSVFPKANGFGKGVMEVFVCQEGYFQLKTVKNAVPVSSI